jgi:gamma-glutamyltranspeptidase/glutathione hydrolase
MKMTPNQGPKQVVTGRHGMVSSSHPSVSRIMVDVLRKGGNAVDAAVAGSLAGPVYEPHMTTISGTVSFLYWDVDTGKSYFLDASPTLPDGLAPFCPHPYAPKTAATLPGSTAGLKAMLNRFGSMPWGELIEPAAKAAREGHTVTSWEYALLPQTASRFLPGRRGGGPTSPDLSRHPLLRVPITSSTGNGPRGSWRRPTTSDG